MAQTVFNWAVLKKSRIAPTDCKTPHGSSVATDGELCSARLTSKFIRHSRQDGAALAILGGVDA